MHHTNLYQVLGIQSDASPEEIRTRFLQLSKTLHPDKLKRESKEYNNIAEAHRILIDKDLRKIYDRHGMNGVQRHYDGLPTDLNVKTRTSKTIKATSIIPFLFIAVLAYIAFNNSDIAKEKFQRLKEKLWTGQFVIQPKNSVEPNVVAPLVANAAFGLQPAVQPASRDEEVLDWMENDVKIVNPDEDDLLIQNHSDIPILQDISVMKPSQISSEDTRTLELFTKSGYEESKVTHLAHLDWEISLLEVEKATREAKKVRLDYENACIDDQKARLQKQRRSLE